MYPENMGDHLAEIKTLSGRFKVNLANAIYHYLEAHAHLRDEKRISAYEGFLEAFNNFNQLKDTSGIIHAAVGLAAVNYGIGGDFLGDKLSADEYFKIAETLHKKNKNVHDGFVMVLAICRLKRVNNDFKGILVSLNPYYTLSTDNPVYKYAWVNLSTYASISYQLQNDYLTALKVNQQILTNLKEDQLYMRVKTMYNMALTLNTLRRYKEQMDYCKKAEILLEQLNKKVPYPQMQYNIPFMLQQLYNGSGDYKTASFYLQRLLDIDHDLNDRQQKEELIFLTKRYQLAEKQKQIAELTLQQTQSENRNRFILTLLGVAVVVVLVVGYLGMRLRNLNQSRQRLFAMVAHDLRRPMHAFHDLGELISFYLQKRDYRAIDQLSKSLNESGLYVQKMLDNMLAWALSERDELPHNPERLHLLTHLEAVAALYQKVQVVKNFKFEIACPADLYLWADPNALDLILRNLIDNSSKVLPINGQVQITATLLPDAPNVQITLTDNGSGLSNEQLALISRTLTYPDQAQVGTKGLGMGLIMIGRFVSRNGGRIAVESKTGQGTTFSVRLPSIIESPANLRSK